MLETEVIEDPRRFAGLADEWRELLAASASNTLFLTWEWLHTWWTHLGQGRRLRLLTARQGGDLVALLPLWQRSGLLPPLLPTLEFLGTGAAGSDYLDAIVKVGFEGEAEAALAERLAALRCALDLRQLPAASRAAALAGALGEAGFRVGESTTDVCPFIALAGHTFGSYLATLGSEHRYNFRRRLRNLERRTRFSFERVRDEAGRRQALPVLFRLHDRRWTPRGGSEAFENVRVRAFHDELSRLALERGWLRLFLLRVDGDPAAALYGFRHGRSFLFYQSGLDPRFARLSVGLVALGLAIESAIAEGASEFDLLHGDEAYKFLWARETRSLARLTVRPRGPAGFVDAGVAWARKAARRAAVRLLPSPVTYWVRTARRRGMWRALGAATPR